MAKLTKQCHECKEQFLKTELIDYTSPRSVTSYSYCPKCLIEKKNRDIFIETVCEIFKLKNPGPRIWTERKRIIEKYGYSDQIISDCLRFLYEEKKMKKLADSLCLVTPKNVEEMLKHKRRQDFEKTKITTAFVESFSASVNPIRVKIKENTSSTLEEDWDPNDFFKD